MTRPRVLIGCPTSDAKRYALAQYLYSLGRITYPAHDILLVDNSRGEEHAELLRRYGIAVVRSPHHESPYERLVAARNLLRERALEYDYLLSLESDVIAPPDVIERLLAHKKEYVTTVMENYELLANKVRRFLVVRKEFDDIPGRFCDLTRDDLRLPLITIERAHLGCTLISTRLLEEVQFRHDGWQYGDCLFCEDLLKRGHTLYCDTRVQLIHMSDGESAHREAREWRESQKPSPARMRPK